MISVKVNTAPGLEIVPNLKLIVSGPSSSFAPLVANRIVKLVSIPPVADVNVCPRLWPPSLNHLNAPFVAVKLDSSRPLTPGAEVSVETVAALPVMTSAAVAAAINLICFFIYFFGLCVE